jgi:hypothetical protein
MMKYLWLIMVFIFAMDISSGGEIVSTHVIASRESKPVSVGLIRQADYIVLPISISSDQKDPVKRIEDIRAAKILIQEKAKENKKIIIKDGPMNISTRPIKETSFFSSSSRYELPSSANINVMLPLEKENPNVFTMAVELTGFISSLKFKDKTTCEPEQIQLAVSDPEQYKSKLLEIIAKDVRKTSEAMGVKGHITVQGLESPVMVRELDEKQVELFQTYSVSIDWSNQ